jgi:putative endonuclease
MAIHNILGQKGEEIAERFLLSRQYKIAARNWRYKKMELDIIAFQDELMVVVEVKTRTTDFIENLNEIITKKKQRFIINGANAYMESNAKENEVRFDVIFIVIKNGKFNLKHIKDAFSPIA